LETSWSSAALTDLTINGNAKKYSALAILLVSTTTTQSMLQPWPDFHTDVLSADFTVFKVKLVDFGANGAFGGGG
jgi:hypothetical protein